MTMINTELSQEEFDLILNYRQGLYKLNITKEEFDMISRFRDQELSAAGKYLQNVEKLMFDEDPIVKKYAKELKEISDQFLLSKISKEDYKSIQYFNTGNLSKESSDKVNSLNYLKDQILFHHINNSSHHSI